MRITAQFNSSDDAEFAAAAIRRELDGIVDVTVGKKSTDPLLDRNFAPVGYFVNMSTGNTSNIPISGNFIDPIPIFGMDGRPARSHTDEPKSADVQVICRKSAAKNVSAMMVSRGGYDIKSS